MVSLSTYQAADQSWHPNVKMNPNTRAQLFRLKGYLEGVGAPREMGDAYNELLTAIVKHGG